MDLKQRSGRKGGSMRVLLIDRDRSFNQGFSFFLKSKDIIVDSSFLGEEGEELARLYEYDIILADLALADRPGDEVLKKLRSAGIKTPFIILSTALPVSRKIDCFHFGADDVVIKPCDRNELLARMQAVIRRFRGYADAEVRVGQLVINLETKVVTINNQVLPLTGKEYALVELLALRRGMTVSKEQFLNHLYGGMDEPEMKIIDVFLFRIRNKMAKLAPNKEYIQTVWGRGYILKETEIALKKA